MTEQRKLGLKYTIFKVPPYLIPRKWSNKSQTGAVRVSSGRKSYSGLKVDPFSDWSKSFYRYKLDEGKNLQRKRRDKTRWVQRQVALYHQYTEVSGAILVKIGLTTVF